MPPSDKIVISGAREHNLADISLAIPRDSLTVITGLSGSGKSSLAFDTIYAEGQRRYVESLSAYARQFLGQMEKPDVDSIEGLSPAISIDQKTTSKNPRSTVGTVTEIYDYLRLLYARIGKPFCHKCGEPIAGQTVEQIVDQVMTLKEGRRFMVLAPVVRGRKGEYSQLFETLTAEGYNRVQIDGKIHKLDEEIKLDKRLKHDIEVVVDRLVMKSTLHKRLSDSVETAISLGEGLVQIQMISGKGGGKTAKGSSAGISGKDKMVFSEEFACLKCGTSMPELEPRSFSFNSPHGACSRCTGIGSHYEVDPEMVVPDPTICIADGAIAPWSSSSFYDQLLGQVAEKFGLDPWIPWKDLDPSDQELFLYGLDKTERFPVTYRSRKGRKRRYKARFEGVVNNLERRYRETESDYVRDKIGQYMAAIPCPDCKGARLSPQSLSVKIGGINIDELCRKSIASSVAWFEDLSLSETEQQIARMILREIGERLHFLASVGVGYLSLSRAAATLSGGEGQRIRLATQIGSSLVGVAYILDEPSIGLHQRDNSKLLDTLARLRDLGNTIVVVEHDEETIRFADHVVDLGPGAGEHGGRIVAEGTPEQIASCEDSLTGQFLSGKKEIPVPDGRRESRGELKVLGATQHNLKELDVGIPMGVFCCITGVSGSGKSTLVNEILYKSLSNRLHKSRTRPGAHRDIEGLNQVDKVIYIDQSPIGRTPRSNPATYTGIFTHIREFFSRTQEARARGFKPGRFSFNVKGGRCEVCRGDGQIKIEMHFLPDVYVPCEQCHGRRYNRETLDIRFKGKTIADVLDMSIEEALEFFKKIPKIKRRLQTLHDVGLDYMRLGQPATTLSGGEAQRVKLSSELSKVATGKTLYILDEPTTGLHFADVERLLEVLGRLVDTGNTVLVIEHNLDVIKSADQIIDLGPEGGEEGGELVAAGTPEEVAADPDSYTGQILLKVLGKREPKKSEPVEALVA